MTSFVLVAGTWLGSSAWDEVAGELRAAGHDAHPLTLSGLEEKRETPAAAPGQQTHVKDIVDAVDRLGLRDVVLVGHSYSGIPVGQAAERIGARLHRVVFVDANVPADGESFVSGWPDGRAMVEAAIAAHGGFWPPLEAADFAGQGLTDGQTARILAASVPHPGATLTEPAVLARPLDELPATYVKCLLDGAEPGPAVAELLATGPDWHLTTLDTGHWPMFSAPSALTRVLLDAAAPTGAPTPGQRG
ncbi:alpha/beta fold hydrolase [Streptomyces sp. ISL-43]|uniref:alpha/beta fold hydrolase n=1 Tax=Streptomyces sp. ISL-43 TaxID=2819183 RepID=UPI001BE8523C|nr:alpha/beta fold hydrolase [Streptomyces sp. ISL-43]MBT2447974.1 alpha/beta fold hydrolase [Streptomyces sp. ISL-43]